MSSTRSSKQQAGSPGRGGVECDHTQKQQQQQQQSAAPPPLAPCVPRHTRFEALWALSLLRTARPERGCHKGGADAAGRQKCGRTMNQTPNAPWSPAKLDVVVLGSSVSKTRIARGGTARGCRKSSYAERDVLLLAADRFRRAARRPARAPPFLATIDASLYDHDHACSIEQKLARHAPNPQHNPTQRTQPTQVSAATACTSAGRPAAARRPGARRRSMSSAASPPTPS